MDGAVIAPHTVVPAFSVYAGTPGRFRAAVLLVVMLFSLLYSRVSSPTCAILPSRTTLSSCSTLCYFVIVYHFLTARCVGELPEATPEIIEELAMREYEQFKLA